MLQWNLIQCLQLWVIFYKSNDIYRTDLWVMAEVFERKEGLLPTKAAKEDRGQKKNFSPKKSERNETLGPKKRRLGTVRAISRTGFFGSYSSSFCFLSSLTKKTEFLKKEPKTQHQKYSLEQSWLAFCSLGRKTFKVPTTLTTLSGPSALTIRRWRIMASRRCWERLRRLLICTKPFDWLLLELLKWVSVARSLVAQSGFKLTKL